MKKEKKVLVIDSWDEFWNDLDDPDFTESEFKKKYSLGDPATLDLAALQDAVSRKKILDKIKELCPKGLSTEMAALRLFVKHTPASQEPGETKEKREGK